MKIKTTISGLGGVSIKKGEIAECTQGKSKMWFRLETEDGRCIKHIPLSLFKFAMEEIKE